MKIWEVSRFSKNAGYRLVYQVKVPADTHPLKEIDIPAD
jgi:hypothetical protein